MTFISDISIWHLYLTFLFDIYIWHLSLTLTSDLSIWHLCLACGSIHFPRLCLKHSWKIDWIHISRPFSKKQWKMYWIAKPFVLPLHFFITKNNTLFQKNSNETRRNWSILAAPDFANSGKKHVHFPYVNSDSREKCIEYIFQYCFQKSSEKCIGSPNPLFYRCYFFSLRKTIHFFKKLERNSPHLSDTGGSWLRQ